MSKKLLCDCEYSQLRGIPQMCFMCLGSKHEVEVPDETPNQHMTEQEIDVLLRKAAMYDKIVELFNRAYSSSSEYDGDLADLGEEVATILGYL